MGQKIKTVTETAGNAIASGAKGLWEGTKNLFAGIGQRASNFISGDGFKTDRQVQREHDMRDSAKIWDEMTANKFDPYGASTRSLHKYMEDTYSSDNYTVNADGEVELNARMASRYGDRNNPNDSSNDEDKSIMTFGAQPKEELNIFEKIIFGIAGKDKSSVDSYNSSTKELKEKKQALDEALNTAPGTVVDPKTVNTVDRKLDSALNNLENKVTFDGKDLTNNNNVTAAEEVIEQKLKEETKDIKNNAKKEFKKASLLEKIEMATIGAIVEAVPQIAMKQLGVIDKVTVTDGKYAKIEVGDNTSKLSVNTDSIQTGLEYNNDSKGQKNIRVDLGLSGDIDKNKSVSVKNSLTTSTDGKNANYQCTVNYNQKIKVNNKTQTTQIENSANATYEVAKTKGNNTSELINKLSTSVETVVAIADKTTITAQINNNINNVNTVIDQKSESVWFGTSGLNLNVILPYKDWKVNVKSNINVDWKKNKKEDEKVNWGIYISGSKQW